MKRRSIKLAAVRLVLTEGLDALTVEAISDAADISPRTFFNYFSAKEDALLMVEPAWSADELLALLAARPPDEPVIRSLRVIAKEIADSYVVDPEEVKLWTQLWGKYPELLSRLEVGSEEKIFLALILAVAQRIDTDPARDIFPSLVVTTAFAAIQWAVRYGLLTSQPIEELIDKAFDLLERGLTA